MLRPITRTQLLVDIGIAGFLLLVGSGPVLLFSNPPAVAVLVGLCAALALRRRSPGLALAAAWVVAALEIAANLSPSAVNIIIFAIVYTTARYGGTVVRWLGFASGFVGAVVIALYLSILPELAYLIGDTLTALLSVVPAALLLFGFSLAGFLLSWVLGLLVRTAAIGRANRIAASEAEQEVAAEQERTRIARDMHDVVAHSLAVVIAQADGARYIGARDPDAVDEALHTIATTSREALADVRVLLSQLRHSQGDAPQPVLADLDRLYEQVRASGLDVRVAASGERVPLGTSTQLAVFRIVQESATNALRHGVRSGGVDIRFDWRPGGLHVTVSSQLPDGPPTVTTGLNSITGAVSSTRHGIVGMTERAALIGGSLETRREGGRFVVRARLPAGETGALSIRTSPLPAPASAPTMPAPASRPPARDQPTMPAASPRERAS